MEKMSVIMISCARSRSKVKVTRLKCYKRLSNIRAKVEVVGRDFKIKGVR